MDSFKINFKNELTLLGSFGINLIGLGAFGGNKGGLWLSSNFNFSQRFLNTEGFGLQRFAQLISKLNLF